MAKQPFVPVPNVIRFRYAGTTQTGVWVNGLAASYLPPPPSAADLATLAVALRTLWTTHLAPLVTTDVRLTTTQVWDISSDMGNQGTDAVGSVGTATSVQPLPVQAAVAISWPVNVRFRGGHFRTYFPARNFADITGGRTLSTAYRTALANGFAAYRTALNATLMGSSSLILCGVRYFPTGFDANGHPIVKTSGIQYPFGPPVVHSRLDTQRRRLGKEIP
jgi:hypothetical protein